MSSLVTKVRLKQIEALLEKGKRLDERGLRDYTGNQNRARFN